MAVLGNGTSTKAAGPTLTRPGNVSFHCWVKSAHVPGSANIEAIIALADSTNAFECGLTWNHVGANAQQCAYYRQNGGSYIDAKLTTSLQADTWYSFAGSHDGSNIKAWLSGVNETNAAATLNVSAVSPQLCLFGDNPSGNHFANVTLGEVAVWNTDLAANEFLGLARGASPLRVRNGNLVHYLPLWGLNSTEPDFVGRTGFAVTAGTQANHAPVTPFTPKARTAPLIEVAGGGGSTGLLVDGGRLVGHGLLTGGGLLAA